VDADSFNAGSRDSASAQGNAQLSVNRAAPILRAAIPMSSTVKKATATKSKRPIVQAIAPDATEAERRRSPRYQTLIGATMPTERGRDEMRCFILNVSDTGALLRPYSVLHCPSQFLLRPDIGEPRKCEVVWTNGEMLAVRFLGEKAPPLTGREWAELGGDATPGRGSVADLFLS
jgi:hypothetical protein